MDELGDENLHEYLTAWAEGALDAGQTAALRRHLSGHPEAWAAVDHAHRLAAEARRVVIAATPAVPPELRARLALRPAGPTPVGPPVRPPAPRWHRYAWAASVLVAVTAGLFAGTLWVPRPSGVPVAAAPVVPATVVAHAGRVHADCSRVADRLHSAGYPQDAGPLAAAVEQDLRTDHPWPDLTAVGFRYVGAGPCGDPLPDAVHLLYKSTRPASPAAVSLFVQGYHGQYPLDPVRLYALSDATDPFPVLAWRTEHVVYFLLADDQRTERRVVAAIAGTPQLGK